MLTASPTVVTLVRRLVRAGASQRCLARAAGVSVRTINILLTDANVEVTRRTYDKLHHTFAAGEPVVVVDDDKEKDNAVA